MAKDFLPRHYCKCPKKSWLVPGSDASDSKNVFFSSVPTIQPVHKWLKGCYGLLAAITLSYLVLVLKKTKVRPLAIKAMAELGIDITKQQSKTLERYLNEPFDEVITVCDTAAEACPLFPGAAKMHHWSFPDPSKATGSEAEQLVVYRHVRDAIRARIEHELLQGAGASSHLLLVVVMGHDDGLSSFG